MSFLLAARAFVVAYSVRCLVVAIESQAVPHRAHTDP